MDKPERKQRGPLHWLATTIHEESARALVAFCFSFSAFTLLTLPFSVDAAASAFGDPRLWSRIVKQYPSVRLLPLVGFLFWIIAALKTGYALQESRGRSIAAWIALTFVAVPFAPVIWIWFRFLTNRL